MGACLKMFQKSEQPPPRQSSKRQQQQPQTQRTSLKPTNQNPTQKQRDQSLNNPMNTQTQSNFSVRQTKYFQKQAKSTTLFSQNDGRSHSSIIQMTLDHASMIIQPDEQEAQENNKNSYCFVNGVAAYRKTGDCIKVSTPDGVMTQLNCQPQYLFSVMGLVHGYSPQCLVEIAHGKMFNQLQSPIELKIKLKCLKKNCKKQLKLTFSRGLVELSSISCPHCEPPTPQSPQKWSLEDISCNFTIWADSAKIQNHQKMSPAPNSIRIIGCVFCQKHVKGQTFECGCFVCGDCQKNQKNIQLDEECWLCQKVRAKQ